MRIIAGSRKGLQLAHVGKGDAGAHLRPTSDRVREALFNTLVGGRYGDPLTDAVVLDLFAGTGALSFEALSRGAARATLVENGRPAQKLIAENLRLTGFKDLVSVLRCDAKKLPPNPGDPANLILLDPPYGVQFGTFSISCAYRQGWIAPNALIVWEENAPQAAPEGFTLLDHRRYGGTHVTLLEAPA